MTNKINNLSTVQNNQQIKNIMAYPSYGVDFKKMLEEQLKKSDGVQFSKHAMERAEQRGIQVNSTLLDSINNAVEMARAKGAKDVVIIGGNEAFIINVPNNIVVTTISGGEMKNNIFTNIDSAVII